MSVFTDLNKKPYMINKECIKIIKHRFIRFNITTTLFIYSTKITLILMFLFKKNSIKPYYPRTYMKTINSWSVPSANWNQKNMNISNTDSEDFCDHILSILIYKNYKQNSFYIDLQLFGGHCSQCSHFCIPKLQECAKKVIKIL